MKKRSLKDRAQNRLFCQPVAILYVHFVREFHEFFLTVDLSKIVGKSYLRLADSVSQSDDSSGFAQHYDVFIYDGKIGYSVGYGFESASASSPKYPRIFIQEMDLDRFKELHQIVYEPLLFTAEASKTDMQEFINAWMARNPSYHLTRNNCQRFSKDFVSRFCGVEIRTQTEVAIGLSAFIVSVGAFFLFFKKIEFESCIVNDLKQYDILLSSICLLFLSLPFPHKLVL